VVEEKDEYKKGEGDGNRFKDRKWRNKKHSKNVIQID